MKIPLCIGSRLQKRQMKRRHKCRAPGAEQGSALLIMMLIAGIVMLLAGSYLMLTANQNQMIARSFTWNTAMPVAEAGIEEALAHMRQNPTNFSGDGWTTVGGTNYSIQRTNGSDYYKVDINRRGMMINVTSTGYALRQGTNYLSRTVLVQGQVWDFKMLGLVANRINLGGALTADSFDSSTNAYSTGGQYVKAKRTDWCLVASATDTFDMGGNSDVRGYVASGPGAPLVTMSGSSSVGDLAWGNTKGWEPGPPSHNTNGFSFSAPDVEEPFDDAPPPGPGVVGGTTYNYVLKGGRYKIGNLDSAGSSTTLIVTKHSALWVTTNLQLASITFTNGAHLDLYISMPSLTFSPTLNGGTAPQFSVFGLPSCTYMKITSANFIGTIYAPEMALEAAGNATLCGAILANTFKCNGTFDFHYDFATQRNWVTDPIQIVAWAEL